MVLSLMDTMRTAVATRNEKVLLSLAELIGTVDTPYQDFPLEQLIDAIVEMSTQPRRVKQISMRSADGQARLESAHAQQMAILHGRTFALRKADRKAR